MEYKLKNFKEYIEEQQIMNEKLFNSKKIKQITDAIIEQVKKVPKSKMVFKRVKDRFTKDYNDSKEPKIVDYTHGEKKEEARLAVMIVNYFQESAGIGKFINVEKVSKELTPLVIHKARP